MSERKKRGRELNIEKKLKVKKEKRAKHKEKMRLKRGSGRGGLEETQGYREYSGSNYRQVQGMH